MSVDAIARLLNPRSVAVIGASADPTKTSGRPVSYLVKHGFSGAIYPVIYSRIGGKVVEHAIEPDPLMRFDTIDSRRTILDLVGRVATR